MKRKKLLDTDVLIDYLRDHAEAVQFVEGNQCHLCVSCVTVSELYAGVRNAVEAEVLEQFFDVFDVLPINYSIAKLAGELKNKYGKSHGTGIADALIAATAISHELDLATLNLKHFPMLDLKSPYQKINA